MKELDYEKASAAMFAIWKERSGTVKCGEREDKILTIDHRNGVFVGDGVVCPSVWFSRDVRPLYLLKEAHGGAADWDLCKDLLLGDGLCSKLWRRVSLWTKGLLSTTRETIPPYVQEDVSVGCYGNAYLKQIAVVNVKKSHGRETSDMEEIRGYAAFDGAMLKKQLELCDPTVIVCGYTASVLDVLFGKSVREESNPNLGYRISLNGHDVLVLDYWHPANHYPDIMNYYGLMGVYQQALQGK